MINAIIKGILSVISKLITILLIPVNALFVNLFPDMTNAIATFNSFVSTYLGNNLSYFFSIFPPIFRTLLVLWFTFSISYYTIYYTYKGFLKIFNIIQKLKFW